MSYRDGTGPMGLGPLTGRGFGYCGTGAGSGCGFRIGMGWIRGFGRGMGYGWRMAAGEPDPYAVPTIDAQKKALAYEQKILEMRVEDVKAQIDALDKSKGEKSGE